MNRRRVFVDFHICNFIDLRWFLHCFWMCLGGLPGAEQVWVVFQETRGLGGFQASLVVRISVWLRFRFFIGLHRSGRAFFSIVGPSGCVSGAFLTLVWLLGDHLHWGKMC